MYRNLITISGVALFTFLYTARAHAGVTIYDRIDYNLLAMCNKSVNPVQLKEKYSLYANQLNEEIQAAYYPRGTECELNDSYIINFCSDTGIDVSQISTYAKKTKSIINNLYSQYLGLVKEKNSFPIYLWTVSYPADGRAFWHNDKPSLAINMLSISSYTDRQLKILFAHEYFHALQMGWSKSWADTQLTPLEAMLYNEGWAVFASSIICNGTNLNELIYLNDVKGRDYLTTILHNKDDFLETVRHSIQTKDKGQQLVDKMFSADATASHPFPPRLGYYLGYEIARRCAEKTSVEKALKANPDVFKNCLQDYLYPKRKTYGP